MSLDAPISVILGNIRWNIKLIAVQRLHAEQAKTRARSGYYRLAILIGSSIVEALIYVLLRKQIGPSGVLFKECQHKESASFPGSFIPLGEDWVMCKRQEVEIRLSSRTDFIHLNNACKECGIYGIQIHKRVNAIRELRNRIHLHGLTRVDRRYRMQDLNKVSSVIYALFRLLKE